MLLRRRRRSDRPENPPGDVVIDIVDTVGRPSQPADHLVIDVAADGPPAGARRRARSRRAVSGRRAAPAVSDHRPGGPGGDAAQRIAASFDDIAHASAEVTRGCDAVLDRLWGQAERTLALETYAAGLQAQSRDAEASIAELTSVAAEIARLAKGVADLANQTGLVTMNAAIEAARAGEAGATFAPVADEVRSLAGRAAESSGRIQDLADRIGTSTGAVSDSLAAVARRADLGPVAADLLAGLDETAVQVDRISTRAFGIGESAGVIYELRGERALPVEIRPVLAAAQEAVTAIEARIAADVAGGIIALEDLFDDGYDPIEGSDPVRYVTRFDAYTDRALPAIQDGLLDRTPLLAYAACIDRNGYVPTHNRIFDEPPTGDYDLDVARSRSKRIFDDPCSLRAAANTRSFLVQTYARETGEIMQDIAVPIRFGERPWGNLRVGVVVGRTSSP